MPAAGEFRAGLPEGEVECQVRVFRRASRHIRDLHLSHNGDLAREPQRYTNNFDTLRDAEENLRRVGAVRLAVSLRIEHDLLVLNALAARPLDLRAQALRRARDRTKRLSVVAARLWGR